MKLLREEHQGFSGLNHVLIAIGLFFLLFLIPFQIDPISSYISQMKNNIPLFLICFLTVCGAALLPDVDNAKGNGGSAASWDLGLFGSAMSAMMITVSSIMTTIFHGKKDVKPNTQHRFFWHTLLVPILILLANFLFTPSSQNQIFPLYKDLDIMNFPSAQTVIIIFTFVCVYVGSYTLFKRISKLVSVIKPWPFSVLLGLASVLCILFMFNEQQLKLIGYCIGAGYLFHLFGDLFADGGIPALFPFTGILGKFFMRIKLTPVTVTTGSTLESMLKIVFAVIDVLLLVLIFFPNIVHF